MTPNQAQSTHSWQSSLPVGQRLASLDNDPPCGVAVHSVVRVDNPLPASVASDTSFPKLWRRRRDFQETL